MSIVSTFVQRQSVADLRQKFDIIEPSNPVDQKVSLLQLSKFPVDNIQNKRLQDRHIRPLPLLPQKNQPKSIQQVSPTRLNQEVGYKEIKVFVINFLHPYLSRECRPENESKNRPSMMEQLIHTLEKEERSFDRSIVQNMALHCYLLQAASGAHRFLYEDIADQLNYDFISKRLVDALRPALKKDFPLKNIPESKLQNLANVALTDYYAKITRQKNKYLSPNKPRQEGRRSKVIKLLLISGKLFVEDIPPVLWKLHK
jgi:hypothetical protein